MRLHHLVLVVACCLALPNFARAETVYEVTTVGAQTIGSKNNSGTYIGQSFNSGSNTLLTTASLEINRNGLNPGNFTLNLYLATGSSGAYFKTGSELASMTESNSVLSTTVQTFYTFNNLNWSLTPNTVYMIGINGESEATVKWNLNQSTTKTGSTGFIAGFAGYNAQVGGGIDDGLHGATITAVPEPSTTALGLLAGVGVWMARLRRRGHRG